MAMDTVMATVMEMKKKSSLFYCFIPKKSAWQTDLLEGMTDIHSHYLPGVDDGMRTVDESVKALEEMRNRGVKHVYLTPHIMSELESNRPGFLRQQFSSLLQKAPEGIALRLAGEYMLDAAFDGQMKEGLLTLSDKYVLIEMSYMYPSPELNSVVYNLQVKGFQPIIAHPERYMFMERADYTTLKEKGCLYQLNLLSLSGQYGKRAYDVAWYLLQHGFYDFAGTDIHSYRILREALERLKLSLPEKNLIRSLIGRNDLLW